MPPIVLDRGGLRDRGAYDWFPLPAAVRSGTKVLRRPARYVSQFPGGSERPVRIAQKLASQQNDIRLPCAQNVLSLGRCGNHAHRASGDLRFPSDPLRKRCLVTVPNSHDRLRCQSTRRHVD